MSDQNTIDSLVGKTIKTVKLSDFNKLSLTFTDGSKADILVSRGAGQCMIVTAAPVTTQPSEEFTQCRACTNKAIGKKPAHWLCDACIAAREALL